MGENRKLKGARVEKGYSQERLAEAIGMPLVTYKTKENGISVFTEVEIKKICDVLEKNVTDIFFTQ
jgi:DNA-binding XRE family transcriptional regulator